MYIFGKCSLVVNLTAELNIEMNFFGWNIGLLTKHLKHIQIGVYAYLVPFEYMATTKS